jgi:hypothetical protein
MKKHKFKAGDVIRVGLDWEFYTLVKQAGPRRGWYVRVHGFSDGSIYRFMAKTMRLAEIVNMDNFVIGVDHAI